MLSGFNTNVRHKGVVFHVQTEDSGRAHPHVITHLFHGGNILASEKRSYEHLLQEDADLPTAVKALMEEQHGAMVEKLKSGQLNAVIRERLGSGKGGGSKASQEPEAPTPIQRVAAEEIAKPEPAPPSPVGAKSAVRAKSAPAAPEPAPAPEASPSDEGAAAEGGQRPLDEVVLDYLLESARHRSKR